MRADRLSTDDWAALAQRTWRRKKWRRTDGTPESEQCAACHIPLHRTGTYYLRPAYTDGAAWLCWRCHKTMLRALHREPGNEYRHRRSDE